MAKLTNESLQTRLGSWASVFSPLILRDQDTQTSWFDRCFHHLACGKNNTRCFSLPGEWVCHLSWVHNPGTLQQVNTPSYKTNSKSESEIQVNQSSHHGVLWYSHRKELQNQGRTVQVQTCNIQLDLLVNVAAQPSAAPPLLLLSSASLAASPQLKTEQDAGFPGSFFGSSKDQTKAFLKSVHTITEPGLGQGYATARLKHYNNESPQKRPITLNKRRWRSHCSNLTPSNYVPVDHN